MRIPNDEVDRETKQSAKIELPWESLGVQIASLKSVRNDRKIVGVSVGFLAGGMNVRAGGPIMSRIYSSQIFRGRNI